MDRLSEELNTIKTNNKKYILILGFFIVVYSAFIQYDVHYAYHIIFILGAAFLTIGYDRIEKELASVRMKNFYIKAKLSYKIEEIEKSITKNKDDFDKKVLQNILEEIEL
ncbi:MAG: hypothetical protein IPM32_08695 [Ignavibacteriae bacterium]|nr:hypothetical protein [Ignavibacteriota bacterium]